MREDLKQGLACTIRELRDQQRQEAELCDLRERQRQEIEARDQKRQAAEGRLHHLQFHLLNFNLNHQPQFNLLHRFHLPQI